MVCAHAQVLGILDKTFSDNTEERSLIFNEWLAVNFYLKFKFNYWDWIFNLSFGINQSKLEFEKEVDLFFCCWLFNFDKKTPLNTGFLRVLKSIRIGPGSLDGVQDFRDPETWRVPFDSKFNFEFNGTIILELFFYSASTWWPRSWGLVWFWFFCFIV